MREEVAGHARARAYLRFLTKVKSAMESIFPYNEVP